MSETAPQIVNVFATRYAGSTWLALMLGSHSQCFVMGEPASLRRLGKPVCTLHGEKCGFWSRIDYAPDRNVFAQVREICPKPHLVVANDRRLQQRQREAGLQQRYIHLLRDGRAVAASIFRKNPGMSMWGAARLWRRGMRRTMKVMANIDPATILRVRYENLVADTDGELQRICEFLGLPFEPQMRQYWEQEHHYLGGNVGTLFKLAHERQEAFPDKTDSPLNWDLSYYRQAPADARKDERWRHELSNRQLFMFGLAAGRWNRRFGYPRALDRLA